MLTPRETYKELLESLAGQEGRDFLLSAVRVDWDLRALRLRDHVWLVDRQMSEDAIERARGYRALEVTKDTIE